MLALDVAERFAKAKAGGHAYLLVCFDSFDRLRGDDDLGYYYVTAETEREVRERLDGLQLGDWDAHNLSDVCEAVIELGDATRFDPGLCEDPRAWLARRGSSPE